MGDYEYINHKHTPKPLCSICSDEWGSVPIGNDMIKLARETENGLLIVHCNGRPEAYAKNRRPHGTGCNQVMVFVAKNSSVRNLADLPKIPIGIDYVSEPNGPTHFVEELPVSVYFEEDD